MRTTIATPFRWVLVLLLLSLLLQLAVQGSFAEPRSDVTTSLRDRTGRDLGEIRVLETPAGLLVEIDLRNVPAGVHGFHVHEHGKCEPPFESAGAHLAPGKHAHGFLSAQGPHGGDLVNLEAGSDGRVRQTLRAPDLTLADLRDADGSAFILHASADDYSSQPAGGSGDRIACALIEPR